MSTDRSVAIEALLAESAWVRRLAESLVHDPAAADDIVQETWLAALRRPPAGGRPLRPWLRRVVQNFARMRGRGEGARAARERSVARSEAVLSPAELYERVETQRMLAQVVLAIEEPFRSTVVWRYYEGLSSAEIARRMEVPEGTVRWRLMRALELLREKLDRGHDGGRRAWLGLLLPLCAPQVPRAALSLPLAAAIVAVVGALGALVLSITRPTARELARSTAAHVAPSPAAVAEPEAGSRERRETSANAAVVARRGVGIHATLVDERGIAIAGGQLARRGGPATGSQPDGGATLVLEGPFDGLELVRFEARAEGFVAREVQARVDGRSDVHLGRIALAPACEIEGQVVDERGRPLAEALVQVEVVGSRWPGVAVPPLEEARYLGSLLPADAPSTRTDAAGRFHLGGQPEGYLRLWASAEGFESAWTEESALVGGRASSTAPIALRPLDPAHEIRGVVLDPAGAAVAGARVECARRSLRACFFRGELGVFRSVADEHGRFSLHVDPNSIYAVAARDPELAWRPALRVPVAPGERGVELRLGAWRQLEVVARDTDGHELDAVEIGFVDARSDQLLALESERWRSGEHSAPYVPFFVIAHAAGRSAERAGPFEPELAPDSVELTLVPAPRLRGRVTRAGRPATGVRIEASAAPPAGRWLVSAADFSSEPFTLLVDRDARRTTAGADSNGEFELALDAGGSWWIQAVDGDGNSVRVGPLTLPSPPLELELEPPGAIEGRVTAADAKAVAGAVVGVACGDGRIWTQRVGPDGGFRFDSLAPVGWQVRLTDAELAPGAMLEPATGPGSRRTPVWDVVVEPGRTSSLDLALDSTRGVRLAGHLGFDGAPPGPWTIELQRGSRAVHRAQLDSQGRFELVLPARGEWTLRARSTSRLGARVEFTDRLQIDGPSFDYVRDWPAAALDVFVDAAQPAHEIVLRWSDGGAAELTLACTSDEHGRATFEFVPAGWVTAAAADGPSIDVDLARGARGEVRLRAR